MKKLFYCFIGVIILLSVVIFFGKSYIPTWVANTLSQKMGVSVWINRISMDPRSTQVHFLTIGNPTGCILKTALKTEKIDAQVPVFALLKDHVVIDRVEVSNLYLGLEFISATDTRGNWTVIMQNFSNSLDSTEDSSKTFLIKTLAVKNTNIDLVFRDDGKVRHLKPVPYMEFKNITSEGPFPMQQLTKIVMSEVLKKIFIENSLKNMLQGSFQNSTKGVYNSLKSLFSLEEKRETQPPFLGDF